MGFLLGCTALTRANSPKHPPGCLQFAEMGKEKGKMVVEEAREEGGKRQEESLPLCMYMCVSVCACACVFVSVYVGVWVCGCI